MIFIKPKQDSILTCKKEKNTTRMLMKKHPNIPDVYYIKPKGQKETLAYIPNIVTSHLCEAWFAGKPNGASLQAEFEYLDEIDKWVPVDLV
jgi:hypothetical protein